MSDLARKLAGKFLVLDGPDGCGKSTQLALLAEWLTGQKLPLTTTRDPGGTPVGEKVREILLGRGNGHIATTCETMLFMASRAQLVAEVIRPALEAGQCVLCDRFISSTIAYQGASAGDVAVAAEAIVQVGEIAVGGLWPDLTVVLDLPPEVGLQRVSQTRHHDRMEVKSIDYHRRVRANFQRLCAEAIYPRPVVQVNADQPAQQIQDCLRKLLSEWDFA